VETDISQLKEQFSFAAVHAIATAARVTLFEQKVDDDSIDVGFSSKAKGKPRLEAQLKCTERELLRADGLHYPLSRKNYDDLRVEDILVPRILIVVTVPPALPEWLTVSTARIVLNATAHYLNLVGSPETDNESSVTIVLPPENVLTPQALRALLKLPPETT
jgi:hypothetical protein